MEKKYNNHTPASFKLNTSMVGLLVPIERINLERINRMSRRDNYDSPPTIFKLRILTCIIDIFAVDPEAYSCSKTLEIFQECMQIFLWHFECSYYEDNELFLILQKVKEVFKHFDEVMLAEFADWYANYSKKLIKRALFRLLLKIVKKCRETKSSFKKALTRFMGDDQKTELNLGNLL